MDTHLEKLRRAELENLRRWFQPGMRVLDVGGGSGFQASILAGWGCQVASIDVTLQPSGLGYFRERYIPILLYDGQRLPFRDACFDVVYSSNMLYHVQSLESFLGEIRRVMKPGAVAVHVVPSSSWRWWTSVAFYPDLARRLVRRVLRRGNRHAPVNMPVGGEEGTQVGTPEPVQRRPLWKRLWRRLRSDPLGPAPSAWAELFLFRRRRWLTSFRAAGFQDVCGSGNKLFYTGYILCPGLAVEIRRRLADILGSACHVMVMSRQ